MKEWGVRDRRTDEQGMSNFEGIKWRVILMEAGIMGKKEGHMGQ
jgi:hypothetical protein